MRAGKRWKKVDVKNSFQYVNFNCRNAEAYGQRVYDCLHKIITDLRKDPPCRKSFQDFVTDMHSAKLGGKINL